MTFIVPMQPQTIREMPVPHEIRSIAHHDCRYLFDHAWNRVREYGGAPDGMGVGLHEARLMHRRAYGAVLISLKSSKRGRLSLQLERNELYVA